MSVLILVVLAGAAVFGPALRSPLAIDDHPQRHMLAGTYPAVSGSYDLYEWVDDDNREALLASGALPWWSEPEISLRLLRPLTSGLAWVEARFIGDDVGARHLHSFVWWVMMVLTVSALYRHTLPAATASVATLLFALGPWHAMPLAWLAARHSLVAFTFGALGLLGYVRWRRDQRAHQALFCALAFSLACAASEFSVALLGYPLAMEYGHRGAPLRQRLLGVMPAALPVLIYVAVRAAAGYGSSGFGFYTDPLDQPLSYLSEAPARLGALILYVGFALGHGAIPPDASAPLVGAAAATLVVLGIVWLRKRPPPPTAIARTPMIGYLGGALLAALPCLVAHPSPRMVGPSALGVAAVAAALIRAPWVGRPAREDGVGLATKAGSMRASVAVVALLTGSVFLIAGPVAAYQHGELCRRRWTRTSHAAEALRADLEAAGRGPLLVVAGRSWWSLPFELDPSGQGAVPMRVLTEAEHVLLSRVGVRTLEARVPAGDSIVPRGTFGMVRARTLTTGEVIEVPGMRVRVLEAERGVARTLRFEFDVDVDLDRIVWAAERNGAFERVPSLGKNQAMPWSL